MFVEMSRNKPQTKILDFLADHLITITPYLTWLRIQESVDRLFTR